MEFRSTLRPFGFSSYDSDDAKTHGIATQLDAQRVATIKKALFEKKIAFRAKNRLKSCFFFGYSVH